MEQDLRLLQELSGANLRTTRSPRPRTGSFSLFLSLSHSQTLPLFLLDSVELKSWHGSEDRCRRVVFARAVNFGPLLVLAGELDCIHHAFVQLEN